MNDASDNNPNPNTPQLEDPGAGTSTNCNTGLQEDDRTGVNGQNVTSVLPKRNRLQETRKRAQPTGCPLSHQCPKKLGSGYGVLQLIFKLREVCSHENWYIYIVKNHVIGGCALNHSLEKVRARFMTHINIDCDPWVGYGRQSIA